MDRFTIEQRVSFVKAFYMNGDSAVAAFRALRQDYGRRNRPTERTISNVVKKFEETGSVTDIVRPVHHRFARSIESIAAVSRSVEDDPNLSIPRRAQNLGLSYGTVWRILHRDLHLHPQQTQQQEPPLDESQKNLTPKAQKQQTKKQQRHQKDQNQKRSKTASPNTTNRGLKTPRDSSEDKQCREAMEI